MINRPHKNVCTECKINVLKKIYTLAKYFDREAKVTVKTTPSGFLCLLTEYLHEYFGNFTDLRDNALKK